jgi:hypothetical protein
MNRRALVWTALLFGAGCGAPVDAGPPVDRCLGAVDCGDGQTCLEGICVPVLGPGPGVISAEVTPPRGSGYVTTQLLAVDLSEIEDALSLSFSLPVPTDYELAVLDAVGAPVAADLLLFGGARIPGRTLALQTFLDAGQRARTAMLAGLYTARIRPLALELPGVEVRGFNVRAQPTRVLKEFRLPSTYRRLFGEVTSSVDSRRKLAGVRVRATSIGSGLLSTEAITDEQGRYLLLLPETDDAFFRLRADPPASEQPAWSAEETVRVSRDADREYDLPLEPVTESVRGTLRLQILGVGADGSPEPIRRATVTLTSTRSTAVDPPVHRVSGATDGSGDLVVDGPMGSTTRVPVLKARYQVEVVPPAGAPFAANSQVLDLTGAGPGFVLDQQLKVQPRVRVSGTIVADEGVGVDAASVELIPLEPRLRAQSTSTDLQGRFEVRLDPGRYLLVARPERAVISGQVLALTTREVRVEDGAELILPELGLAPGVVVTGLVRGARDGAPLAGATVELFLPRAGQQLSLGRAESSADGTFTLVLPRGAP